MIDIENHGGYNLDEEPESLGRLLPYGNVVVGEFEFCPFPSRLHEPAGVYNLEWRYYGCIEQYRNITVVKAAEIEKRVCGLVDCTSGFKDWAPRKKD